MGLLALMTEGLRVERARVDGLGAAKLTSELDGEFDGFH